MSEFTWVWNCMRLNWSLQNWLTLIFARFPRKFVASVYIINYMYPNKRGVKLQQTQPNPTKKRTKYFLAKKRPNSISTFSAHLIPTNFVRIKWKHTWLNSRYSRIDSLCLRQGDTALKIKQNFSRYLYVLFITEQFSCSVFIMLFAGNQSPKEIMIIDHRRIWKFQFLGGEEESLPEIKTPVPKAI